MFRFTIRDVLWLTVVVALAVGWWTNRGQFVSENARLRQDVKRRQEQTDQIFSFYKKKGQWIEWRNDGTFLILDP